MSSPAVPSARRDWQGLTLVLALALAFRLAYWLLILPTANRGLVVDEPEYFGGAVVFASGRGFSFWDTFLWTRPPVYPVFLGGIFQFFGHDSLLPARLLQLGLNLASIAVLYLIARRCFDARVALVTGIMAAFYLPFTIMPYMLLGETLFILLLGLFLLTLTPANTSLPPTMRSTVLAGILLGVATLVRGTTLVYIPLAALVLWLGQRARRDPERGNSKLAFVLLLTALLTLGPWTVRNFAAYGYFIPTDTTGGYNFWLGANGVRDGGRLASDLLTIANQGARQSYAYAQGAALLEADPLGFVGKGLKEMNDLWAGNFTAEERFTRGYTHGLVPAAHLLASIILDDTLYLLLVPLAIVGLLFAPRRPLRGYVLMWALTNFALAFIFFAVVRFRLAVLFFLLPYAAWALLNLRSVWQSLRRVSPPLGAGLTRGLGAAVLIIAFLIANLPSYPLAETAEGVAMWGKQQHILVGDAALGAGDKQTAIREYNQADAQLPETQSAQASISLFTGDYAQAQAIGNQITADYWGRYLVLGAAARQQGQDASGYFGNRVVRDNYAAASDWAWLHLPATRICDLPIGSEGQDMGAVRGFAASEKEGTQSFRWTVQANTSVRLCPISTTTATLTLRMKAYRPAPLTPLTVRVSANGATLGSVVLSDAWADYQFVVARSDPRAATVIDLSSDTFVPSGSDPRLLGFMLMRAKLEIPPTHPQE